MATIQRGSDQRPGATRGEGSGAPVSAGLESNATVGMGRSLPMEGDGVASVPARRSSRGGPATTVSVAVVGATGYAGGEVVRLLARHPHVRIVGLVGRNRDHEPIGAIHPHLAWTGLEIDATLPDSDAVFLALPHGAAAEMVPEIARAGRTIVDLGPDFRLHQAADYPRWYRFDHPAPELLARAVYGLPELHRAELRALRDSPMAIVGAPGCYPTATVLALAPLARAGLIGDLVVDAKSGVSGAGRDAKPDLMFGEVNESVKAYGLGGHRHVAEVEQELAALGAEAPGGPAANPGAALVDFLPHLIPMTRGILSTCHVRPTRPVTQAELDALYAVAYAGEPFVRVVADPPATKHVLGSNECRVHVRLDQRTGRIIVIGVIDNLVKGAAGQAIQAFNLVHGLQETAGLEQLPLVP
ncbi:MAG TPA: N-acetyl-gamma-glutamyl-phosphate reductase [Candidatus Saccharimonadales bacterium]|nr:N-acetyl-gamma-glutamyl-phosphate reductase [Candidatus Saccharimonadales bacterium]